jgi:choloylglycine hydrolase
MRRALAFLTLCLAGALPALACTTFCVRGPDGLLFGRNYDYFFGDAQVLVNPRGVEKVSLLERQPARWTAKHGSVTFNQYGRDNPMGGVNERGFVVELMELQEAKYPGVDSRPAVGALEWIQYLLDNFASVEEALQGAKRVRIGTNAPLHFLLADRSGDTAVVEFLSGRMLVRRGETLPDRVLANTTYDDSREYAAKPGTGVGELPRGLEGSLERFTRAARSVKAYEAAPRGSAIDRSFEILDEVAQRGHTQWQVVYDLAHSTIHYRTTANRERRTIALTAFDFSCKASGRMLDVDTGRGDVTAAFMPYAPEANERQMLVAFAKSPHFGIPPQAVRAEAAQIENTRRCVASG